MEFDASWSPAAAAALSLLPSAESDEWRSAAARRAAVRAELQLQAQTQREKAEKQRQQQQQQQPTTLALSISGAQVPTPSPSPSQRAHGCPSAAASAAASAAVAATSTAAVPSPRPSPSPPSLHVATALSPSARLSLSSRGAARGHRRHPSSLGSSPLAKEESDPDGADENADPSAAAAAAALSMRSPLDECPSLFAPAALAELAHQQPYLQDVQELAAALQHITQESGVELDRDGAGRESASSALTFGSGGDEIAAVLVPSVSVGWSGNRRQQVSETMLQLTSCVERLLVEPENDAAYAAAVAERERRRLSGSDSLSGPDATAVPTLRSEFLSSRELLSVVDACASSPADLAPGLLALSKSYQNRLLELQVADQVRLEIDPPTAPEPLPLSKRQRKLSLIATAAAAAKQTQPQQPIPATAAAPVTATAAHPPRHARRISSFSGRRPPAVPAAIAAAPAIAPAPTPASASASLLPRSRPAHVASKWLRLENQGSLEAYLPWNLVAREKHLFDPAVVALTKLFWRACFLDERGVVWTGTGAGTGAAAAAAPPLPSQQQQPQQRRLHERSSADPDGGGGGDRPGPSSSPAPAASISDEHRSPSEGGLLVGLPRRLYMQLFTLVHFVLKPSYLPSYAQAVVAADWAADVRAPSAREASRALMSLPLFHLALFGLVDTWTEGVTLAEYVEFLRKVFVFVTEEVPHHHTTTPPPHGTHAAEDAGVGEQANQPGVGVGVGGATAALPAVSNVFRRRLKPLTIVHINNLRRLGLRARTGFRDLTPEMLAEIEERSRAAAATAAARLASQLRGDDPASASPGMSRASSTASILGSLARAREGMEPEEYDPHRMGLGGPKRFELSSLIHRPAASATSAGRESRPGSAASAPGHRRRPSKGMGALLRASRAEVSKSIDDGSGPTTAASAASEKDVAPGERTSPRHKRAASREGSAFPSWVTLSSSPRTARAKPSSHSRSGSGSGSGPGSSEASAAAEPVARRPRFPNAIIPSSTPSSVREEEEGQEDDDGDGEDGDDEEQGASGAEAQEDAAMRTVLEAASATPIDSLRDGGGGGSGGSKRPRKSASGSGALSWRRPSSMGAADENDRAMAEAFAAMKVEFEEIKRARRREREEAARARAASVRTKTIFEDEEDEQGDEDKRRRRRRSGKSRLKNAIPVGGETHEEKENGDADGDVYNPFLQRGAAAATAEEDQGDGRATPARRGSAIASAKRNGHSSTKQRRPLSANGAIGASSFFLPRPPASFEQQRLAFRAESADYLARITRLQEEARVAAVAAAAAASTRADTHPRPSASGPALGSGPPRPPQRPQQQQQQQQQRQRQEHVPLALPLVEETQDGLLLKQLIQRQLAQPPPPPPPIVPENGGGADGHGRFSFPGPHSASAGASQPYDPSLDPTALMQRPPVLSGTPAEQVAQLQDLARMLPASMAPTAPAPPFSMLLAARGPVPSCDARDRFWRLMPQGRVLDARMARAQTARASTSAADRCRAHLVPSGGGYCECYWCVEHLSGHETSTDTAATAPAPSGNGAHLTARGVHRLMAREVAAPNRSLDRIERVLQCI